MLVARVSRNSRQKSGLVTDMSVKTTLAPAHRCEFSTDIPYE